MFEPYYTTINRCGKGSGSVAQAHGVAMQPRGSVGINSVGMDRRAIQNLSSRSLRNVLDRIVHSLCRKSSFMADPGFPIRDAPLPIEDYALIGDCRTAALVGRDGAIDWLCLPRFDGPACFAALAWHLATELADRPSTGNRGKPRSYRAETLVLETVFKTPEGEVALIDAMPTGLEGSHIIRRIEGAAAALRCASTEASVRLRDLDAVGDPRRKNGRGHCRDRRSRSGNRSRAGCDAWPGSRDRCQFRRRGR